MAQEVGFQHCPALYATTEARRTMTQFPNASPIRCACCHSGKNALFLHGPCDPEGQILAAKYQVTCAACGASGPLAESAAKALEGWRLMSCPSPLGDHSPGQNAEAARRPPNAES